MCRPKVKTVKTPDPAKKGLENPEIAEADDLAPEEENAQSSGLESLMIDLTSPASKMKKASTGLQIAK
jgi:hypothetical protein